ncbi:MAG: biotin--[acetyl-CoA-carboxylase] ligase [Candidatus Latescibacteria bacterium]|nr:biotin--[acetyl-CoA-carboxylase] ligase [Candidatus Latescibacterota bacterium]
MSCLDIAGQMTEQNILSGLKTRILGRRVYCHASVNSTNQIAKRLAFQGAEDGTLVVAEEQIAGKGKRGHGWESAYGCGIWASLIFRPEIPSFDTWKVTLGAAVSIIRAIRRLTELEPTLKWPNDILLGARKVGGILTEINTQPNQEKTNPLILGFGLNVTHRQEDFSEELRQRATSLYIESGKQVSRITLLQLILEAMEEQFSQLENSDHQELLEQWRDLSVSAK